MKILWIPHSGWHIPQRAHLFCRALSERHEVHVTDWVADFNGFEDYFSVRYLRNFFYRQSHDGKITIHGIPRISPALFSKQLRRLNTRIYSSCVQKIIDRNGIKVVVGTFVVPPPQAPRIIFDLFDDNVDYWRSFRHNFAYANEIAAVEEEYITKADAVVTVSSVLAEKVFQHPSFKGNPRAKEKVTTIPNGVNLEKFRQAEREETRKKLGIDQNVVIGYISALGEFSGLQTLVEAFVLLNRPDAVLLVVGDGPARKPVQAWLRKHEIINVIFTGSVPFDQVHHYLSAMDIGVIPMDKSPFTDASCPIKLLEYSAAGKIVVSTNLEEVCRLSFPNVLIVKDTAQALSKGIRQAISLPSIRNEKINNFDLPLLVDAYEAVLASK